MIFTPCSFSELELRGGSGPHEGNIYVNGQPVCDDGDGESYHFSKENAIVVCRFGQSYTDVVEFPSHGYLQDVRIPLRKANKWFSFWKSDRGLWDGRVEVHGQRGLHPWLHAWKSARLWSRWGCRSHLLWVSTASFHISIKQLNRDIVNSKVSLLDFKSLWTIWLVRGCTFLVLFFYFFSAPLLSCGSHQAQSCADCPKVNGFENGTRTGFYQAKNQHYYVQGNGKGWCHGVCEWRNEKCESGTFPKLRVVFRLNLEQFIKGFALQCHFVNPVLPAVPLDASWASWTSWSECTRTCGGGVRTPSCCHGYFPI